ncbi:MAG: type III-B CRISPR module RAMP protein Cmr4 [Halanaerobiales bacterium]|nr:type III-B CRISPR module RAMP protein Cmr4 [Halanaerobiales bacterium]
MVIFNKIYLAKALQPIHIGTGGYHIGRIDNKIVRDEEGVPIVPGTTLSGAARSYLSLDLNSDCAGTNGCGKDNCPICLLFGFSKEEGHLSRQGMVQIYDARLLFFPVATMYGPIWVTTKSRLDDFGSTINNEQLCSFASNIELSYDNEYIQLGESHDLEEKVNLGWLVFHRKFSENKISENYRDVFEALSVEPDIINRSICIHDDLFQSIVDDNLEKRTSVAIDPETNTADEGALFSYEAIPRTSYFYFDVTYNHPRGFMSTLANDFEEAVNIGLIKGGEKDNELNQLYEYLEKAFSYFKYLGIGGMTTRGFGRIEVKVGVKDGTQKS